MEFSGNIRKMKVELGKTVQYALPLYDILEKDHLIPLNDLIGQEISITFLDQINCVVSGKKIRKVFADGMSYQSFMSSPLAVPSIIRPELSRIHEGIALRDMEWEKEFHLKPHYVYLALTSGVKVGVTRDTQVPTRWIDQGAVKAIKLAKTPYRQLAGLIEVALKSHVADKTNWQVMLKNQHPDENLFIHKMNLINQLPSDLLDYVDYDNTITDINYPVTSFPEKVKSMKLEKIPVITKKLTGIKGQYLIFDDETVMNIRTHAGYKVKFSF